MDHDPQQTCSHPAGSFSVYVHYPFCRGRCGYCSFPTTAPHSAPQGEYRAAVLRELDHRAAQYQGGQLRSIYVGGGTPSLWRWQELAQVVGEILGRFDAPAGVEITAEANPSSLHPEWIEGLLEAGINRLSLGLQSLDDQVLALLGRRHRAREARHAVQMVRRAGCTNVSCDLIFGVPGQSLEQHSQQLEQLVQLAPEHLSAYGLTLSPDAPLHRSGKRPVADEQLAEMMEAGRKQLATAGYRQYEVSSHCRPRRRSRHNSLLWAGRPYLGLGALAHSMTYDGPLTLRLRSSPPERYLKQWSRGAEAPPGPGYGGMLERVPEDASRLELVMLGLRTTCGVDRAHYRSRFGADILQHSAQAVARLTAAGLLAVDDHSLRPTRGGIWHADELALRIAECASTRERA